jgi:hypothetical protein
MPIPCLVVMPTDKNIKPLVLKIKLFLLKDLVKLFELIGMNARKESGGRELFGSQKQMIKTYKAKPKSTMKIFSKIYYVAGRIFLSVMTLSLLFLLLLAVKRDASVTYLSLVSTQWPSSRLESIRFAGENEKSHSSGKGNVIYTFRVAGVLYEGSDISFNRRSKWTHDEVRKLIGKIEKSREKEVFYNPANPNVSVLETGGNRGWNFFFLFGSIFLAYPLFVFTIFTCNPLRRKHGDATKEMKSNLGKIVFAELNRRGFHQEKYKWDDVPEWCFTRENNQGSYDIIKIIYDKRKRTFFYALIGRVAFNEEDYFTDDNMEIRFIKKQRKLRILKALLTFDIRKLDDAWFGFSPSFWRSKNQRLARRACLEFIERLDQAEIWWETQKIEPSLNCLQLRKKPKTETHAAAGMSRG